jgi:hypothetical protein
MLRRTSFWLLRAVAVLLAAATLRPSGARAESAGPWILGQPRQVGDTLTFHFRLPDGNYNYYHVRYRGPGYDHEVQEKYRRGFGDQYYTITHLRPGEWVFKVQAVYSRPLHSSETTPWAEKRITVTAIQRFYNLAGLVNNTTKPIRYTYHGNGADRAFTLAPGEKTLFSPPYSHSNPGLSRPAEISFCGTWSMPLNEQRRKLVGRPSAKSDWAHARHYEFYTIGANHYGLRPASGAAGPPGPPLR